MIGAVRWPRYQFQSWMEQRGTIYQVLITVVTRIEEVLKGIKDRSSRDPGTWHQRRR